ncbi:MAG: hypothetical protein WC356_07010 [Candidatus Micrarchaeia archaeon]
MNLEQKSKIEETVWRGRDSNLFLSDKVTQEQTDLKLKLANHLSIIDRKNIIKLDEGVARAFRDQDNPEYKNLFREGNPELIETVALIYYYLGDTNATKVLINNKLYEKLDLSSDVSLAHQLVNLIPNEFKSQRIWTRDWLTARENIAKASLSEKPIEIIKEDSQEEISRLTEGYTPKLRVREIKIPEITEMPVKESPKVVEKPPIIKLDDSIIKRAEKSKQQISINSDLDINPEAKSFGKIELTAPEDLEEIMKFNVLEKSPEELEKVLEDIEILRIKYEMNKNYAENLDRKYDEVYDRLSLLQERMTKGTNSSAKKIETEEEIVFPQLDISQNIIPRKIKNPEITEMPVRESPRERTEELSILSEKDKKRAQKQIDKLNEERSKQRFASLDELSENMKTGYSRGKVEKYEEEPVVQKSKEEKSIEEIVSEVNTLEIELSNNVTKSKGVIVKNPDIINEHLIDRRIEYSEDIIPGFEIPYVVIELDKGKNAIEKYNYFDISQNPFEAAIQAGRIKKQEASLLISISVAERDYSILTMASLDEEANSLEYAKRGETKLSKIAKDRSKDLRLEAVNRQYALENYKKEYAELTSPEKLQEIEEIKPPSLIVEEKPKPVEKPKQTQPPKQEPPQVKEEPKIVQTQEKPKPVEKPKQVVDNKQKENEKKSIDQQIIEKQLEIPKLQGELRAKAMKELEELLKESERDNFTQGEE